MAVSATSVPQRCRVAVDGRFGGAVDRGKRLRDERTSRADVDDRCGLPVAEDDRNQETVQLDGTAEQGVELGLPLGPGCVILSQGDAPLDSRVVDQQVQLRHLGRYPGGLSFALLRLRDVADHRMEAGQAVRGIGRIFCCAEPADLYAIAAVDHALRLALLLQQEGPMRISDVAIRLEVSASTAHRLLAMLVYRGFAEQLPDRRYKGGLRPAPRPTVRSAGLAAASSRLGAPA